MDKTLLLVMGIGIVVAVVFVVMYSIQSMASTSASIEKIKLIKGEISVFQYCAHIGKAAIDDDNCKAYNLLYGPNS